MFNFNKQKDEKIKCTAVIVAAGQSTRMNELGNKQFVEIFDKPLLAYTLESFQNCEIIDEIIIVTKEEDILYCRNTIVDPYDFDKVNKIICGGRERQYSVYNGLKEVSDNTDIVIIHDGARPLVTIDEVENCIYECLDHDAISAGVKAKNTIKIANDEGFVKETPDRNNMWITQTPQVFKHALIKNAHEKAKIDNYLGTDDAVLVERLGYKIKMVEGSYKNIKVTTVEDLQLVKAYLNEVYKF